MSKFTTAEQRERKAIEWFINSNPTHKIDEISPIGNFASNDFKFFSGGTHIVAEVKIRDFESNKYPTAIINMDKINRILNENDESYRLFKSKFLYFAFYPKSRELYIFDLMNTPTTISYQWTAATTMGVNKERSYKPMLNFRFEDAISIIKY
jgi:hypothetical protein